MQVCKISLPVQIRCWPKLCIVGMLLINSAFASGQGEIRKINYQLPYSESPVPLTVEVKEGLVFLEGDIILGTEDDLFGIENRSAVITSDNQRWPGGIIPYEIEEGHPQAPIIIAAIAHVNAETTLNLVNRNPEVDEDYVRFVLGSGCGSYVGRQEGEQLITIANGCGFGNIVHEICHAAGLYHEQARTDRDEWVTIHWDNIMEGAEGNFLTYVERGDNGADLGPYNYNSIMHYGSHAFSKNGETTITVNSPPATPGTTIGQRDELDIEDVAAINALYPCIGIDVLMCPDHTGFYSKNVVKAENSIVTISANECNSAGAINPEQNHIWQAGEVIYLGPGFHAESGSNFIAEIRKCNIFDPIQDVSGGPEQFQIEDEVLDINPFLRIYPNPLQNYANITFELPHSTEVNLQVFDVYGKLIHQEQIAYHSGLQEVNFDGSQLPKGMYTVVLSFDNNILSERMVVN